MKTFKQHIEEAWSTFTPKPGFGIGYDPRTRKVGYGWSPVPGIAHVSFPFDRTDDNPKRKTQIKPKKRKPR